MTIRPLVLAASLFGLAAPLAAQQGGPPVPALPDTALAIPDTVAADEASLRAPWLLSYFPLIAPGFNDGPVFGATVRYWQPADYEARYLERANLVVAAGTTIRGSRFATLAFTANDVLPKWRLRAQLTADRLIRLGYYGLGNTTVRTPAGPGVDPLADRVARNQYLGDLSIMREVAGPVRVMVGGQLIRSEFTSLSAFRRTDPVLGGRLAQDDASGRAALVLDLRDNEFNPSRGLYAEVGGQVGSGAGGYQRLWTQVKGYVPLREGTVFAARVLAADLYGTPTLDARYGIPTADGLVPVLGSQLSHRALVTGRFIGTGVLLGNAELRAEVKSLGDIGALGLIAFVDVGRVFEGERLRLTTDGLKVGGGGGVSVRILRGTIFTFVVARGPEGTRFTSSLGWMF